MTPERQVLEQVFINAECLFSLEEVEAALREMAKKITLDLSGTCPVIIGVMTGAVTTLGYLLPQLPFLMEVDYVHATRYQGAQEGSDLVWKRKPELNLTGRTVLLVDDILDKGITLAALTSFCKEAGAADVRVAVLGVKQIAGFTASVKADYKALDFPDRYVFGYGMDYHTFWRNAPGIYACK